MDHIDLELRGATIAPRAAPCALVGWPLEAAIVLDAASSGGFLRATCGSRSHWKQAFAAALAGGLLDKPGLFLARALGTAPNAPWAVLAGEVAELLPAMKPREIVQAGFGECPTGYLGALFKLGAEPISKHSYIRLLDLFTSSDPVVLRRRAVLFQLSGLNEDRLQAVEQLDPVLLHPLVMARVRTAEHAQELNQVLAAIRLCCSSATDDAIRQSLSSIGAGGQGRWIRNWLAKADQGATALELDDPELEVVGPSNVGEIADRFGNCLRTMMVRLLGGTWAAVAMRSPQVVLTFVRLTDGRWLLSGIYGPANAPISTESMSLARAKVGRLGDRFVLAAEAPTNLRPLIRAMDPFWAQHDLEDVEFGLGR
jgi:hypothetical protein